MSTISVNLPDPVFAAVSARAAQSGAPDVEQFVSQMIAKISERQTELEDKAIEGLESGPSEVWQQSEIETIRKDLQSRHGG